MPDSMDRRTFLTTSTAGVIGAGAVLRERRADARVIGANDRVRLAVVGTGRQGLHDMTEHAKLDDVQVVAVCDVYETNLALAASAAPGAERVRDFRRILDRNDVDAVVIATPDHWHPLMTVMACQAGKDVYVEKPTSVAVAEGRAMVEAARKYQRVVQVGTQQRSAAHFRKAVEVVRGGLIGTVSMVRCWNAGNTFPKGIGVAQDAPVPEGLDWDMWLGPAPQVPFNANRFGVRPDGWSTFRYFWDYAGGMMTDWGVHLIDIVHWAMAVDAPTAVGAVGGTFALHDTRETPDTIVASYRYPGFVMTYENRSASARAINGHGYGIEFHGTDATLFVDRSGFEVLPEKWNRMPPAEPRDRAMAASMASTPDEPSHARNFVDCIKSRKAPASDIEGGHRSTSAAILGNLAFRSGASLAWDGKAETIQGNDRAKALLARPYREPWTLKV
jgi:predicted dehydrogenase